MVSGRSRGAQKGRPKVNIRAKRIKGVGCLVLIKGRRGILQALQTLHFSV